MQGQHFSHRGGGGVGGHRGGRQGPFRRRQANQWQQRRHQHQHQYQQQQLQQLQAQAEEEQQLMADLQAIYAQLPSGHVALQCPMPQESELRVFVPDVDPPESTAGQEHGDGASGFMGTSSGAATAAPFAVTLRAMPVAARRGGVTQCRIELNGAALLPEQPYRLSPGDRVCVFSWTHAMLRLEGPPELVSEALAWRPTCSFLPRALAEYHCHLHAARDAAQKAPPNAPSQSRMGPRVVVCGGPGSGKWTATATLANYCARMGWSATVADLDPDAQHILVPGSVAVAALEYPLVWDEPADLSAVSVGYFVGTTAPQQQQQYGVGGGGGGVASAAMDPRYHRGVQNALAVVNKRLEQNIYNAGSWAGCIVKLPTVRGGVGAAFVQEVIDTLNATHVLCLGDDHLFNRLRLHYDTSNEFSSTGSNSSGMEKSHVEAQQNVGDRPLRNGAGGLVQIDRLHGGTGPCRMSQQQRDAWRGRRFRSYFELPFMYGTRCKGRVKLLDSASGGDDTDGLLIYRLGTTADGAPRWSRLPLTAALQPGEPVPTIDEQFKALIDCVGAIIDPAGEPSKQTAQVIGVCRIRSAEADGLDVVVEFLTPLYDAALPPGYALVVGDVRWGEGSS